MNRIILVAVAFEIGLGLLALAIGWLVGHDPLSTLVEPRLGHGAAIAWGVAATIPLLAGLAWIGRARWRPLRRLRRLVDQLVERLFARANLAGLALVSLAAGVGEELLFRGLLQGALHHWLGPGWGTWAALATASLAFGLAHAITRTYALLATLMGLYLGLLFVWTGNLLVPILVHALYDFAALVYLRRWGR